MKSQKFFQIDYPLKLNLDLKYSNQPYKMHSYNRKAKCNLEASILKHHKSSKNQVIQPKPKYFKFLKFTILDSLGFQEIE